MIPMTFGFTAATWVAIAAAAASATVGGVAAAQQADAQKKSANYNAQVAANNAKLEANKRSDAVQRGEIDAQNAMRQQAQLVGQQRASLAANGVDLTQGSAQDLLATTRFLGQQDTNTIQSNAAREAWGYEVQGGNFNAQGQLDQWQADNITPAARGGTAAASSLLSSASAYASGGAFEGSGGTPSGGANLMKGKVSFNKL